MFICPETNLFKITSPQNVSIYCPVATSIYGAPDVLPTMVRAAAPIPTGGWVRWDDKPPHHRLLGHAAHTSLVDQGHQWPQLWRYWLPVHTTYSTAVVEPSGQACVRTEVNGCWRLMRGWYQGRSENGKYTDVNLEEKKNIINNYRYWCGPISYTYTTLQVDMILVGISQSAFCFQPKSTTFHSPLLLLECEPYSRK